MFFSVDEDLRIALVFDNMLSLKRELTTTGAPISSINSRFSTPSTCAAKLNSSTLHLLGIIAFSVSPLGPTRLPIIIGPPLLLLIMAGIVSGSFINCFAIVPSTLYPVITTPFFSLGAHLSNNSLLTPFWNMPGLASMTHSPTSSKRSRFLRLRTNRKSQGPALPTSPASSASAIRWRKTVLMLSFMAPT